MSQKVTKLTVTNRHRAAKQVGGVIWPGAGTHTAEVPVDRADEVRGYRHFHVVVADPHAPKPGPDAPEGAGGEP